MDDRYKQHRRERRGKSWDECYVWEDMGKRGLLVHCSAKEGLWEKRSLLGIYEVENCGVDRISSFFIYQRKN